MAIGPSVGAYGELGQKFTEDNKTFGCSVRGGEICGSRESAKRVTYDKVPVHCAGTKILRSRHYGSLVLGTLGTLEKWRDESEEAIKKNNENNGLQRIAKD